MTVALELEISNRDIELAIESYTNRITKAIECIENFRKAINAEYRRLDPNTIVDHIEIGIYNRISKYSEVYAISNGIQSTSPGQSYTEDMLHFLQEQSGDYIWGLYSLSSQNSYSVFEAMMDDIIANPNDEDAATVFIKSLELGG